MGSNNRHTIKYKRLNNPSLMENEEGRDNGLGDCINSSKVDVEVPPNGNEIEMKKGTKMDRMRGIVVVFSAFCIQVLVFGISSSIGVYNIQFLEAFQTGSAAVSLIGSINLGMLLGSGTSRRCRQRSDCTFVQADLCLYLLSKQEYSGFNMTRVKFLFLGALLGPISSVLMARWSHRKAAFTGAALCSLGLVCMPFAPNMPFMYFFYGVLGGLGFSLVYIPSFILSGLFYKEYRSVATGIVSSGAGLGSTLFPFLFYKLIEHYKWRGSLLVVAGINLHLFVFVTLLQPAPSQEPNQLEETKRLLVDDKGCPKYTEEKDSMSVVAETSSLNEELPGTSSDAAIEAADIKQREDTPEDIVTESEISSIKDGNRLSCHTLRQHLKVVFTFDFIIYIISNIGWNAGGGILLIFLPKYMTSIGLTEEVASLAFSLFGASRCIGCVSGGFLGNSNCCDRIWLYILANLGAGLVTLAFNLPTLHSLYGQLCLVGLFGFLFGIILSLQVSMTCDLLGTEALGHGFGVLMLANGVGIFIGPPIGGALIDHMKTQVAAITLSGAFTIFGGVIMVLVPICSLLCGHQSNKNKPNNEASDSLTN